MQRPQVCISEGTLLIRSGTDLLLPAEVETTPYSHDWKMVIGKSDLDTRLSNHGWNLFFIATTLRTTCLGASVASLHKGLNRLLNQTSDLALNSLRVTQVASKKFLGINYQVLIAHPCHLQQGCFLETLARRKANNTERAQQSPTAQALAGSRVPAIETN